MTATTTIPTAPGPSGRFLFRNLSEIRRDAIGTLERDWREYGDIYRIHLGRLRLYVVSSPELAQEVLIEGKHRFGKINTRLNTREPFGLRLVLGNGLLTNPDEDSWLMQRRMMQPMFHRKRILAMSDKMAAAGQHMLARWAILPSGSELELHHEMLTVTMDIVTRTMFSTELTADAGKIGENITTALEYIFHRTQSLFRLPLSFPTSANRRFHRARQDIETMLEALIWERRHSSQRHGDLLDMLLEARDEDTGESMTRDQIRHEVATIFGAGHETTANALTWTWYLLSQHPDILKRLQSEVDTVLEGRHPTLDDLPHLPYTLMVFQEALRLYPPAPIVPRLALEETSLAGYGVEKHARVLIGIHNIHRHPAHWSQPEVFNPERFTPEAEKGRHRLAFMPFGGGARLCIGNHFALMEGQLLLALMTQHYELRLVPGHPVERRVAITLRPKYGLRMTLHRR